MTDKEARAILKLREDDILLPQGIQNCIDVCNKRLEVWSISKPIREEIELELSALMFLLKESEGK